MRTQRQVAGAITLVAIIATSSVITTGQVNIRVQSAEQSNQPVSNAVVQQNYDQLALSFVPNAGQTDQAVHFQVNSLGGTLFFTAGEVVLSLPQPRKETNADIGFMARAIEADTMPERLEVSASEPPLVVKMQLIGADAEAEIVGADPLPGIVNYFIGNDPSQWHANISTYAGVVYRDVYPGIDLRYDGHDGRLKGTYTVAAGVDPSVIRWRYEGNTGLSVDDKTGDLLIGLANGNVLREVAPTAWQEGAGKRESVPTRYALDGEEVKFQIGAYDTSLTLVIDPEFVYSTYLGGVYGSAGNSIAVDGNGYVYLTGYTTADDFPTVNPLQGSYSGNTDVFITKLNAAGNALIYSTFLGGSKVDGGNDISIDGDHNVYITGYTDSTDFPTVNPVQMSIAGNRDAFIAKLNAAGNALVYSTFLGGSGQEYAHGIAVDSGYNATIVGETGSVNFPISHPLQNMAGGAWDAFVTKLNATGSALVYSTYLGGSASDHGNSVAADGIGNIYITGLTISTNFPTSNPLQSSKAGDYDVFVTKLDSISGAFVYSTYLGGSRSEFGIKIGIAVDGSGNAYITGHTSSTNFPTRNPIQASNAGSTDAFVTKLNAIGSALVYSTYLGGSSSEEAYHIAVDSSGNAYVVGSTSSTNFPTANPIQATNAGIFDAFITKLNAAGNALVYSSYLGGSAIDNAYHVTVDSNGSSYVTGITDSRDFPTVNPLQGADGYFSDAFVVKISGDDDAPLPDTIGVFRAAFVTFYLRNSNTTGIADSTVTFGGPTDFPITGDWNGDGIDTPGVYRTSTGEFFLTNSTANLGILHYSLVLGIPNDQPIVGDWDGDGRDGVGVFRPSNGLIYLKNALTTGFADFTMVLGVPGDVGIAGDWNGDGKDSPGVYRPSNQQFYLSNSICNCSVFADAQLGLGIAGDTPFVGDWDGDGKSGVGVYRQSNGLTYIKNALTTGFADASFVFGSASDYPLAGYWVRVSPPAVEAAPTFVP